MSENYYYVWAILPFALFGVTAFATWKRVFKIKGREYPREYLIQAIYCTVFLVVAILIDQYLAAPLVEMIPFESVDGRIIRWLVYPIILSIAAGIQHLFDLRKEQRERDEMRERQLKYTQKGY